MIISRLFGLVALTTFVGCASAPTMTAARLGARLVAPADVKLGDSAQLRLTVYNESSSEARIVLWADNGFAFDPIVRQGNVTIWQRSLNNVIISGTPIMRIPPGDSLTFLAVWHLIDSDRHAVSPGIYQVVALLKDEDGRSIIGDGIEQAIRVSPR
jgi:hypothetical protein